MSEIEFSQLPMALQAEANAPEFTRFYYTLHSTYGIVYWFQAMGVTQKWRQDGHVWVNY